jgi:ComF family protein
MLGLQIPGVAAATPSQCEVCRAWPAQALCHACLARFAQPRARCRRCALPVPQGVAQCGRCLREPPPLDACLAAVDYGYPWSTLVGRYKFEGQPGWAASLAALMRQVPGAAAQLAQARWVLPMPLSRERLAARGFNQALELARRLAPERTDAHLVLRLRDTAPQASLDRAERQANVRHAFAVEPQRAGDLQGSSVLLVDDVMTSGASLFALANVVRAAGAGSVSALVFARTPEN